jgi:hypothetical protein
MSMDIPVKLFVCAHSRFKIIIQLQKRYLYLDGILFVRFQKK